MKKLTCELGQSVALNPFGEKFAAATLHTFPTEKKKAVGGSVFFGRSGGAMFTPGCVGVFGLSAELDGVITEFEVTCEPAPTP